MKKKFSVFVWLYVSSCELFCINNLDRKLVCLFFKSEGKCNDKKLLMVLVMDLSGNENKPKKSAVGEVEKGEALLANIKVSSSLG